MVGFQSESPFPGVYFQMRTVSFREGTVLLRLLQPEYTGQNLVSSCFLLGMFGKYTPGSTN